MKQPKKSLDVNDIESLLKLVKEYQITQLEIGEVKILKTIHEPKALPLESKTPSANEGASNGMMEYPYGAI